MLLFWSKQQKPLFSLQTLGFLPQNLRFSFSNGFFFLFFIFANSFELLLPGFDGICTEKPVYDGKSFTNTECHYEYSEAGDFCVKESQYDLSYYSGLTFYRSSQAIPDSTVFLNRIVVFESDGTHYQEYPSSFNNDYTLSKPSSCSCENVVKKVVFQFFEDSESVSLDIFIIPSVDLCTSTTYSDSRTDPITYTHEFITTVLFMGEEEKTFIRSGNPGYQIGSPLLFRNYSETDGAENILLYLPSYETTFVSRTGECIYNSTVDDSGEYLPYYPMNGHSVLFGQDQIVSCSIEFTLNEFKSFCQEGDEYRTLGLMYEMVSSVTEVGVYGNSWAKFNSEWVEIEKSSTTGLDSEWDSSQSIFLFPPFEFPSFL